MSKGVRLASAKMEVRKMMKLIATGTSSIQRCQLRPSLHTGSRSQPLAAWYSTMLDRSSVL